MSENLKHRIPEINSLAMLKMEKNFIAHIEKRYPRQPYRKLLPSYLLKRIKEEVEELEQALLQGDILDIMEECADISNIVDYLFEVVLGLKKQKEKQR